MERPADEGEAMMRTRRIRIFDFFMQSLKMTLSQQMAYKFNFILRVITLFSFDMMIPLVTIIIYSNTKGFPGWGLNEIILFQGIFIFLNSIDRMFFQRVDWTLSYDVRTGGFDRYLLFPINTLAYISFTNLSVEHIADFLIGIVLALYSFNKLNISISIFRLLLFMASLLFALMLVFSIAVIKYSIILRTVRIGRLGELVRTVKNYGQYPNNIFSAFLSSAFRFVLPISIFAFVPSKILLESYSSGILVIFTVIIAIFIFSLVFWKESLKKYTSAGG
ncbi:MAG: ABC-2 family transporter protein [Nanoarchaeota archaeon]|nr:ABC-2 family transporter protein [Nanoarchaeota archaeon]